MSNVMVSFYAAPNKTNYRVFSNEVQSHSCEWVTPGREKRGIHRAVTLTLSAVVLLGRDPQTNTFEVMFWVRH